MGIVLILLKLTKKKLQKENLKLDLKVSKFHIALDKANEKSRHKFIKILSRRILHFIGTR